MRSVGTSTRRPMQFRCGRYKAAQFPTRVPTIDSVHHGRTQGASRSLCGGGTATWEGGQSGQFPPFRHDGNCWGRLTARRNPLSTTTVNQGEGHEEMSLLRGGDPRRRHSMPVLQERSSIASSPGTDPVPSFLGSAACCNGPPWHSRWPFLRQQRATSVRGEHDPSPMETQEGLACCRAQSLSSGNGVRLHLPGQMEKVSCGPCNSTLLTCADDMVGTGKIQCRPACDRLALHALGCQ